MMKRNPNSSETKFGGFFTEFFNYYFDKDTLYVNVFDLDIEEIDVQINDVGGKYIEKVIINYAYDDREIGFSETLVQLHLEENEIFKVSNIGVYFGDTRMTNLLFKSWVDIDVSLKIK